LRRPFGVLEPKAQPKRKWRSDLVVEHLEAGVVQPNPDAGVGPELAQPLCRRWLNLSLGHRRRLGTLSRVNHT